MKIIIILIEHLNKPDGILVLELERATVNFDLARSKTFTSNFISMFAVDHNKYEEDDTQCMSKRENNTIVSALSLSLSLYRNKKGI